MDPKSIVGAYRVFTALVKGEQAERAAAQASLQDPAQDISRPELRRLILEALKDEFQRSSARLELEPHKKWARGWLLSTLSRVSDGDEVALEVVEACLDDDEESPWTRYWALEGLWAARAPNLAKVAKKLHQDEEPLVRMLATAILASTGDEETLRNDALRTLHQGLEDPDRNMQWSVLRALRAVRIEALTEPICKIVDQAHYSDETFDAVVALGRLEPGTAYAELAAQSLGKFVVAKRSSPIFDGIRSKALIALGELREESSAPILVRELSDDNPAVVRDAARSLERILGVRTAASRVVEAAAKADHDRVAGFANSLRWMNRDAVAEELEAVMVSGAPDYQDTARILLGEIGGSVALQKLRARTSVMEQFTKVLKDSEAQIRTLFETSIREARSGFKLATFMDAVVFFIGVGLIATSAGLILKSGGNLAEWAGIGVTGGAGVLGVLYAVLVKNPRRQVREAVDHLMFLKVVFLAYLRQLHQADQAYARRLLEEDPLTVDELNRFASLIGQVMTAVSGRLESPPGLPKPRPAEGADGGRAGAPADAAAEPAERSGDADPRAEAASG